MGRPLNGVKKQQSFISVPTQIINPLSSSSIQSLLLSPPKKSSCNSSSKRLSKLVKSPKVWFSWLFFMVFLGMLKLYLNVVPLTPFLGYPCAQSHAQMEMEMNPPSMNNNGVLISSSFSSSIEDDSAESEDNKWFWKQPDGLGYKPCLEFSQEYKEQTPAIVGERRKYLMVVVSGGMNQQRNQIVDAVVIARILGAVLVVPVLQVNAIWGDESEFSDIFDLEHFKSVLADDVKVLSSLPSTHLRTRPIEESQTPLHASPQWIRQHYHGRLRKTGVLLLRSLDSRLSKDLPSDLLKLRCKVAFHALRFAPHILELGNRIAERMSNKGPYVALHLRMEKDVWVRTGCSPGPEYDELINSERMKRPKLLTARSNMTAHERRLAGLCPLNPLEVARLLKALGAPKSARIYWAGGQPLGGKDALLPLTTEFPHFYNKQDLALPGELEPFAHKASFMAAIDYIVCEKSDVFMASHGGNMGHALQGQRAHAGHKKFITPNKRHMLPYFMDPSIPEEEFNRIVKELHKESLGQPEIRTNKPGRDVTKYPVPECMCNATITHASA